MSECIVWTGCIGSGGYGHRKHEGRTRGAHVVAWEAEHGPVPAALELDHLCRNRACVNVEHLEPVTRAENARRGANAKITMAQAEEIRTLRAQGWRRIDVATVYGISVTQVRNVVEGISWA